MIAVDSLILNTNNSNLQMKLYDNIWRHTYKKTL
jgi:hypothetical protein